MIFNIRINTYNIDAFIYALWALKFLSPPSSLCDPKFSTLLDKNIHFVLIFHKTSLLIICPIYGIFSILLYNLISVAWSVLFTRGEIVQQLRSSKAPFSVVWYNNRYLTQLTILNTSFRKRVNLGRNFAYWIRLFFPLNFVSSPRLFIAKPWCPFFLEPL